MGFVPVNAMDSNPVEFINEATDGVGVQYSVEACGLPVTFLQAVQVAGMFGEVVFMGNIVGEFKIGEKDFSNILRKELKIQRHLGIARSRPGALMTGQRSSSTWIVS